MNAMEFHPLSSSVSNHKLIITPNGPKIFPTKPVHVLPTNSPFWCSNQELHCIFIMLIVSFRFATKGSHQFAQEPHKYF